MGRHRIYNIETGDSYLIPDEVFFYLYSVGFPDGWTPYKNLGDPPETSSDYKYSYLKDKLSYFKKKSTMLERAIAIIAGSRYKRPSLVYMDYDETNPKCNIVYYDISMDDPDSIEVSSDNDSLSVKNLEKLGLSNNLLYTDSIRTNKYEN